MNEVFNYLNGILTFLTLRFAAKYTEASMN